MKNRLIVNEVTVLIKKKTGKTMRDEFISKS